MNIIKGQWAEWSAWAWLTAKGYRTLARNYRSSYGEVDLIMFRGGQLVIVEVKYRANRGALFGAVRENQKRRLMRAARSFQQSKAAYRSCPVRFDAVLIGTFSLQHVKDAWRDE